jgi:hypothetical protein
MSGFVHQALFGAYQALYLASFPVILPLFGLHGNLRGGFGQRLASFAVARRSLSGS